MPSRLNIVFFKALRDIVIISGMAVLICGCGGNRAKRNDTTTSGFARFASDESLSVILKQEVDVFEALYPDAILLGDYVSEAEVWDLLVKDSVRLAFTARDFTDEEKAYIKVSNKQLMPRSQRVAVDGIALITHGDNTLPRISLRQLRDIMTGQTTRWDELDSELQGSEIRVVFDHPNSGTARLIRDSVCSGQRLSASVRALHNNPAVLEYVKETPNALGIIGVGWVSNPHDSTHLSFNDNINILALSRSHPAEIGNSFLPYPAYLHLKEYPLTRDIYAVLTDMRGTLPSGFTNFIAGERGQRIILKAGLVPATMPLRTVVTRENL